MRATRSTRKMTGSGGRRGGAVAVYPLGWYIAGLVFGALYRFCSGQVVLRRPGRWDSRYLTWAAEVPENIALSRDDGIPRSRWARRPGWHRQVVRFGTIALVIAALNWPTQTAIVMGIAIAVWSARRAWDMHELAYYERTCGKFLAWTSGRVGWQDLDPDPRAWIELPPYRWEWPTVAPIRAALARSGDSDTPDGWLVRVWPWLGTRLAPLTTPIPDWSVSRWLIETRPGRRKPVAIALRLIGTALVRSGEATRRVRVRPRLVRPELSNPDAKILIRYPATYQAHGADLSEIERVVTSRMPDGPWKFRHDADELLVEVYHPTTLPRYLEWDRSVFAKHSQLECPIGMRGGDKVVSVNLKGATPHINASGKTGRGKTVTCRAILGNFLYHGGHTVIVDPKRIDFVRTFRRMANVDLVTVPARFPTTMQQIDREMERRYQIIEQYTERADELGLPPMEENAELYFQPLMLMIDEKSGFTAICNAWWKREGADGKPGKGVSVVVDWERNIVARGRACCIYALAAAQQNSLGNTFPDTDIRSNYQYKILAGPADAPSWMVTFPGEKRRTLSSDVKGRAIVGVGSELFEAQLANISPAEIREAAIHGLNVRDDLNIQRAERLSMISGRPLWEVSPLPWWVPLPPQTGQNVPGHESGMDTPAHVLIEDEKETAQGTFSEGKENPVQSGESTVININGTVVHDSNNSSTSRDDVNSNSGSEDGVPGEQVAPGAASMVEEVRGNRAAADYLGASFEAFRKARQRAEQNGETIPGMRAEGRFVVYDVVQLAEWWNQRPGSGRKAS